MTTPPREVSVIHMPSISGLCGSDCAEKEICLKQRNFTKSQAPGEKLSKIPTDEKNLTKVRHLIGGTTGGCARTPDDLARLRDTS